MAETILIALALIVILSAISLIDKHFLFFAGLSWLWAGMTVFLDVHIAYMFMTLGVGLVFIFKGVWEYVPEK